MRPFDLSERSPKELFKSNSDIASWPAGGFDYQLTIYLSDPKLTDDLCGWLSENCTQNFVVSRLENKIIAGGCSNNKLAWKQRHRRNGYVVEPIIKLQIRLDEKDVFLFRMCWFDKPWAVVDSIDG